MTNDNTAQISPVMKVFSIFYLILVSMNPHFAMVDNYTIVGAIILTIYGLIKIKDGISLKSIYIAAFFLSFEIIHGFMYEFFILTFIRIFLYFVVSYWVIRINGNDFIKNFVNAMYIFAIISLIIYPFIFISSARDSLFLFSKFFPVVPDYSGYSTPTIIFYAFDSTAFTALPRNSGCAWEAGAFVSILIPAFFFDILHKHQIYRKLIVDHKTIILSIAIFTTMSTTGYLAYFIVLLSFFIIELNFKRIILLIVFSAIFWNVFNSLPFLSEKIQSQVEVATTSESNNRVGAFIQDYFMFKERPFFGYSRKLKYQFGFENENIMVQNYAHRPNGIGRILVSYGIFYFLGYLILMYYSIKKFSIIHEYTRRQAAVLGITFILLILTLNFSQLLFEKNIFRAMLFGSVVFMVYKKDEDQIQSKEKLLSDGIRI